MVPTDVIQPDEELMINTQMCSALQYGLQAHPKSVRSAHTVGASDCPALNHLAQERACD
jgi:hypothetical protein